MIKLWPVTPVPAPRQVNADRWSPSDRVKRYRAYRDELKLRQIWVPTTFHHAVFLLPMPKSWKPTEREAMDLTAHKQTPDRDNLEKALLDATFGNDCEIWNGQTTKLWGCIGGIIVADHPLPVTDIVGVWIYQAFAELERTRAPFAVLKPEDFTLPNHRSI